MLGTDCSPCCCPQLVNAVAAKVSMSIEVTKASSMFFGPTANAKTNFSLGPVAFTDFVDILMEKVSVAYLNRYTAAATLPPPDSELRLDQSNINPVTGLATVPNKRWAFVHSGSFNRYKELRGATGTSPGTYQELELTSFYDVVLEIVRAGSTSSPPSPPNCFTASVMAKTVTEQYLTNYIDLPYGSPEVAVQPYQVSTAIVASPAFLLPPESELQAQPEYTFTPGVFRHSLGPMRSYVLSEGVNGSTAGTFDFNPVVKLVYEN